MNRYLNATSVKIAIAAAVGYYVGKNGLTISITKAGK